VALSDRGKIQYAKSRLRRKYRGDDLLSGGLTVGKYYLISKFCSGDDFKNVGATKNAIGQIFKATGTTPTAWTHGSILNEILLDDLKADADTTFAAATDTVTLTSGAFEGGSQSGEITFEKILLGKALEELIGEYDPDFDPASRLSDPIGVTVRL
jgi:hypothetical protein